MQLVAISMLLRISAIAYIPHHVALAVSAGSEADRLIRLVVSDTDRHRPPEVARSGCRLNDLAVSDVHAQVAALVIRRIPANHISRFKV